MIRVGPGQVGDLTPTKGTARRALLRYLYSPKNGGQGVDGECGDCRAFPPQSERMARNDRLGVRFTLSPSGEHEVRPYEFDHRACRGAEPLCVNNHSPFVEDPSQAGQRGIKGDWLAG